MLTIVTVSVTSVSSFVVYVFIFRGHNQKVVKKHQLINTDLVIYSATLWGLMKKKNATGVLRSAILNPTGIFNFKSDQFSIACIAVGTSEI